MSSKNEDLKTTITKMVLATTSIAKGKKASGTKIASFVRDIPIVVIAPFSL